MLSPNNLMQNERITKMEGTGDRVGTGTVEREGTGTEVEDGRVKITEEIF